MRMSLTREHHLRCDGCEYHYCKTHRRVYPACETAKFCIETRSLDVSADCKDCLWDIRMERLRQGLQMIGQKVRLGFQGGLS